MIQEWRTIYKNEVIPRYRRAGIPSIAVWRTGQFGDPYEFTLMSRMQNFARFDGEDPSLSGTSGEESVRTQMKLDRCVASVESAALLLQPETSVARTSAVPPLIMVQTVTVSPKNAGAYFALLKEEVRPVIEKAGVDVWLVYRHVFGSDANRITTFRSLKNYGELDAGPLAARVLSPEKASSLAGKNDQLVETSRIVLALYDKELSYGSIFREGASR